MFRLKLILITLFYTATAFSNTTIFGDEIIGTWLTANKEAKITIFKGGNYFYGKIAWLKIPNKTDGKPKTDEKNPDEKLRSRHILGMLLLKGFEFNEKEKQWINGEIYDPKTGKTYSCKMKLTNSNTLEVRGYVGISLMGKTEVWTRSEMTP